VFSENRCSEIHTLCNGIKEILPLFLKFFFPTCIEFDIDLQNHGTDTEFEEIVTQSVDEW
jgi:hypothetical protein